MKTKQTIQIPFRFAIFVLLIGLSSCMDEIFVNGNGQLQIQNRSISGFEAVSSSGDYHVSIVQGDQFSVEVQAESNLLPYIETNLSGKTLKIGTSGVHSIKEHFPIEVFITQPKLSRLNLSGSGFIKAESFVNDNFEIGISGSGEVNAQVIAKKIKANVSGSGSIMLTGESSESDFRISGSGKIKAYDLIQEYCQTSTSGSGDIYVNVSKALHAGISGSGNVFYIGYPSVNASISGSGQVVAKN
jgi:hypothetical protein